MKIAITGANGFVGRYLCEHFHQAGHHIVAITRRPQDLAANETRILTDYSDPATLSHSFAGVDVIIHLAGVAHTNKAHSAEYYRVNLDQTLNIARAAALANVRQFIFFSSIKVNGEFTTGKPFSCNDTPSPKGHYANSKWMAEQELSRLCLSRSMQLLIIRPPLIYGDTPKGNLDTLVRALRCKLPLPLKNIDNKRDMVSLPNIAGLLDHCLLNPALDGKTLLVSDGSPLSTTDLVKQLANASNLPARLFDCPKPLRYLASHLPIVKHFYDRLFQNLEVDINKTIECTGWSPANSPLPSLNNSLEHVP